MSDDGAKLGPRKEPSMFCIGCGYPLDGIDRARCPECGREFDATDPASYRTEVDVRVPYWRSVRLVALAVYGGAFLALLPRGYIDMTPMAPAVLIVGSLGFVGRSAEMWSGSLFTALLILLFAIPGTLNRKFCRWWAASLALVSFAMAVFAGGLRHVYPW